MPKQHEDTTMKRSLAIIALSTVFLSTAAFAQSAGEKTGVNSTLGIAPKTEDFIKEAAMSDMLEIEAAKIAQQKGNRKEKTFAGQMITDHTKTSSELKGMVSGDMKAAIITCQSGKLAAGRIRRPAGPADRSTARHSSCREAVAEGFAEDGESVPVRPSAGTNGTSSSRD